MDLLKLLPDHPKMSNKELDRWLTEHRAFGREVLAYRDVRLKNPLTGEKEPFAECVCTACWAKWHTPIVGKVGSYSCFVHGVDYTRNGFTTTCPECGEKVDVAHARRLRRWGKVSKAYPWEIIRRRGCIIFVCWLVTREIDAITGEPAPRRMIFSEKRNAYLLDPAGKWHRFTALERSGWSQMSPMESTGEWREMDRFELVDGGHSLTLPHPADVYDGTALENAKMDRLEAAAPWADPIFYARLYQRHPQAENLAMQCPDLLAYTMAKTGYRIRQMDWIDWTKARPHEMLRMDKQDFKTVASLQDMKRVKNEMERIEAEAFCVKHGVPKEYGRHLGAAGMEFVNENRKTDPLASFGIMTTWNYVLKQKQTDEDVRAATRMCKDYWKDLIEARMNDGTRATLFPRDLMAAHARVVAAIQYKKNRKLLEKFEKAARRLEPLAWQYGNLCIRPARSEAELIMEGKTLGHCVGGYGSAHCKGDSIFFVRRADTPNLPYFTLQLDTKKGVVLQNRGKHNCARTEEVAAFEKAWLAEVVQPWIEEKAKKTNESPADLETAAA